MSDNTMRMTVPQVNLALGLFITSGSVSLICSSLIIYKIFSNSSSQNSVSAYSNNTPRTYHRVITGLSIADIIASFEIVFFSIFYCPFHEPSPACSADGFFAAVGSAAGYYNMALSFYYVLVLVLNVKEERLRCLYEPILLIAPAVFAIACAVTGLVLEVYNPMGLGCLINTYPVYCADSWGGDPNLPCERGIHASTFLLWCNIIPKFVVWISIIINNLILFCKVRSLENGAAWRRQSQEDPSFSQIQANTNTGQTIEDPRTAAIQDNNSMSKRVATQGFLYVGGFFACNVLQFVLVVHINTDVDGYRDGKYYPTYAANTFLWPIQGLFNFLVYIRPTYLHWRACHAGRLSRWQCLWRAVFSKVSPASASHPPNAMQSAGIARNGDPSSFLRRFITSSSMRTDGNDLRVQIENKQSHSAKTSTSHDIPKKSSSLHLEEGDESVENKDRTNNDDSDDR